MDDDILGEVEFHADSSGIHQGVTKELTWIDQSPVDPPTIKVPEGFTTLVRSTG